jgi:glucose-6-phosphate 1-epimerase
MSELDVLNERFRRPGLVAFEAGAGRLARAAVTAPGAAGHLYLHGAHLTHWQPVGERPVLFLSSRSRFELGRAIRGGVPVIFPWFGARAGHPSSPDHGFARTSQWTVESVEPTPDGVALTLALEPDQATRAQWPHEFCVHHRVVLGRRLVMTLEVENRSAEPFSFEAAFHTYLLVGDVREVSLTGLDGAAYIDKMDGFKRKAMGPEPFRPASAIDRVFLDTRTACTVHDPVLGRRLLVEKTGSASTVVWNPWRERAQAMGDLGPDEWPSMLCVETANAAEDAIHLAPAARHAMSALISTAPL